ncbi:hypothetical protein F5X96DRAFT_641605 [Biscogniauxia mediterranea]|nr:hypothetical protein F5X96DRAFT_641605 [Biscogniauxia mediterranea]
MPTSNERPGAGTPSGSKDWHEVVLRQKYNDPRKLKESLDTMYGQGGYQVKTKANRYILKLPVPLDEGQLAELEKDIGFHYNN